MGTVRKRIATVTTGPTKADAARLVFERDLKRNLQRERRIQALTRQLAALVNISDRRLVDLAQAIAGPNYQIVPTPAAPRPSSSSTRDHAKRSVENYRKRQAGDEATA